MTAINNNIVLPKKRTEKPNNNEITRLSSKNQLKLAYVRGEEQLQKILSKKAQ